MTRSGPCQSRGNRRRHWVYVYLLALPALVCLTAFAQSGRPAPLILPMPLGMEWSESFNPFGQDKLAMDRFRLRGGTENLKLQFSNQAPAFLGGKQFIGLPGGYRLTDVSYSRKWGTVYGFRSAGYDAKRVQPGAARKLSGAGVEFPKAPAGIRLAAYLVRATPAGGDNNADADGLQLGLSMVRELKKGLRLQAEWTQSQYRAAYFFPGALPRHADDAKRGAQIRIDGTLVNTNVSVSYLSRDEGLANPAAPRYSPGRNTFQLNVQRKLKNHQFQFSSRSDGQRESPLLHTTTRNLREEAFLWTYTSRCLPVVAVSQTWSRQSEPYGGQVESSTRLSVSKKVRKLSAALTVLRGARFDEASSRPMWNRTTASGDTTFEIRRDLALHVRYERSGMVQQANSQVLSTSNLRLDTRISLWAGKLSLAPALDLRRQGGDVPSSMQSAMRALLTTGIKLPRRIPGTDLTFYLSSQHVTAAGRPDRNRAEFSMRWNIKRM